MEFIAVSQSDSVIQLMFIIIYILYQCSECVGTQYRRFEKGPRNDSIVDSVAILQVQLTVLCSICPDSTCCTHITNILLIDVIMSDIQQAMIACVNLLKLTCDNLPRFFCRIQPGGVT